jgi:DNA-binding NarL/FixJ family response regulator
MLKAFVVEDIPSIREGLIEALAELGGIEPVGFASTEKAATGWLLDAGNQWDLAIVDLVLEPRGGSGFGVLRALQQRDRASRKVVVLTGTASPDVRRQCEALGSDGVFDKAMETESLLAWCQDLVRAAGHAR